MNWLQSNKDWIFSGLGTELVLLIIGILIAVIKFIFFRNKSIIEQIEIFNLNIGSGNSINNSLPNDLNSDDDKK